LLDRQLVDEMTLLIHPLVLGSGRRLFPEGIDRRALELVSSDTTATGVLSTVYRPAK
jgi:dihydrofolate reductase